MNFEELNRLIALSDSERNQELVLSSNKNPEEQLNELGEQVFNEVLAKSRLNEISIDGLVKKSQSFEVSSQETSKQALSMALQARDIRKAIDSKRIELNKPALSFQRAVNAFSKTIDGKLRSIEQTLQSKIQNFDIERKEAHKAVGIAPPETKIKIEEGGTYTQTVWEFTVVDESKIPREFLMVNEKAINESIRKGVRKIDGVEIKSKEITRMRRK